MNDMVIIYINGLNDEILTFFVPRDMPLIHMMRAYTEMYYVSKLYINYISRFLIFLYITHRNILIGAVLLNFNLIVPLMLTFHKIFGHCTIILNIMSTFLENKYFRILDYCIVHKYNIMRSSLNKQNYFAF